MVFEMCVWGVCVVFEGCVMLGGVSGVRSVAYVRLW